MVQWDVTATIDTPAKANDLKFVIRNNSSNGKKSMVDRVHAVVEYSLAPTPPSITSSPSTSATVNQAYSYQGRASGTTPITWTLPTAPAGMTVNGQTGLVSWTPTGTGTFPVTLQATNDLGSDTQSFNLSVGTAPTSETVFAAGDIAGCGTSGDEATAALLDGTRTARC